MAIQSAHNLNRPLTPPSQGYGVRVSLRPNDPFIRLLGPDWNRVHWYATAAERDAALADMSRKHDYSRATDSPALVFTKVENLTVSRNLTPAG